MFDGLERITAHVSQRLFCWAVSSFLSLRNQILISTAEKSLSTVKIMIIRFAIQHVFATEACQPNCCLPAMFKHVGETMQL